MVPQERRFVSVITGDLIVESVMSVPDFCLVRASNVFGSVEQHAANLVSQPEIRFVFFPSI